MNLQQFLNHVNNGRTIRFPSEELAFSDLMTQEALKITMEMNSSYHSVQEIRELFAELTSQPLNESLLLIPPFYTDFGRNIHVGKNVYINMGCTFQDHGGIYIGDGALLGHHATVVTLNHDEDPLKRGDMHPAPVHIGKRVWIGANVTVLPGVTIGDGAIIGAGAVVTKDIPAGSVAMGVPARVHHPEQFSLVHTS